MAESSLALVILGVLTLATLEFWHARNTAQIAELALLEALRAGASDHASPHAMQQAFEHAMRASLPDTPGHTPGTRLHQNWQRRQSASGLAVWRLDILNPGPASLADHAAPGRDTRGNIAAAHATASTAALAFYYQDLRHQEHLSQGWPQGKGPTSGQDVFEANLLTLRLRYLHQPLSAPARWFLQLSRSFAPDQADSEGGQIARAGLWPIYRTASLPMASEAWPWPQRRLQSLSPPGNALPRPPDRDSVQALPHELPAPARPGSPEAPGTLPSSASPPLEHLRPNSTSPPATPSLEPEPPAHGLPEASEPLCGVLLCCAQ